MRRNGSAKERGSAYVSTLQVMNWKFTEDPNSGKRTTRKWTQDGKTGPNGIQKKKDGHRGKYRAGGEREKR